MRFEPQGLRFYTQPTDSAPLDWLDVDAQLRAAGTYWVTPPADGYPHPRPVWGVWLGDRLALSIGTPAVRRVIADQGKLTVHLDSGTEVVIVEGDVAPSTTDPDVIAAYDTKYDWRYDAATYGPLAIVVPRTVLAWRAAGPAGRDGFRQASKWLAVP